MAYRVRIEVGKGKNRSVLASTPLSSKKDVRRWVKQSPLGNSSTKVSIKDLNKNKTITKTKAGASLFGKKFS